jgi:hypothetical protein
LDAADSNTVTGTTSVTAWNDKSGNGYVANSFVNSVPNPSWVSNVQNGNGVIQYSAGNGSSIANFVLAQTMSIFKVYYPINQNTGSPFIEHGPNVNNESGFYFHAQGGQNFAIRNESGQVPVNPVNFGNTTISNTWQMIQGINPDPSNSNAMTFYLNGTVKASSATTGSGTSILTKTLYINGRGGANNLSYNTYLAELIIYNIGVTTSQRQQVEGYLAHKWGLTGYYDSSIPLSIPGCQLWLDAADTSSLTLSGSTITQWNDKSGNGRNGTLFQNYPTYTTNRVNFNGTQGLATSLSPSTNIESGFVICGFTSVSSTNTLIGSGMNDLGGRQFRVNNAIQTIKQDIAGVLTSGTNLQNNTTYLCEYVNNGTILTHYLNGNSYASGGSVTYTAGGNITSIGYRSAYSSYAEGLYGYIQEVLVFNTALTTTQRQTIEGYLARKWGLTSMYSALPSIHPFYSIRPHLRGFQPTDISGCQLWLDGADQSSLVLSGSNVTTWRDKSGSSNHFTPTSGTPTSISDNGRSVVNFTSGTIMRSTNQITFTSSSAFFIVSRLNSDGMLLGFTNINGADFSIRFYGPYGPNLVLGGTDGTGTNGYDLGNNNYYVNGTFNPSFRGSTYSNVYSLIATVAPSSSGTSFLTLSSAFLSRGFIGNIAEFLYYPGGVTSTQRQQVEGYLAHKWGLNLTYGTNTPLSIPGCTMWLDGADPSGTGTPPSAGTLSTWVDKSGNGRNGIQYSTFARPQFVTNSLNSRGGVSFSAASSNCYQTQSILPIPGTIFIVGFTSDGGFCLSGIPTPNSGHPPYYASFVRDVEFGVNNTSDTVHLANVTTSLNTNYILTGLYTGSNVSVIINGGTLSNTVAFSGTPKTPATTLIGLSSYAGSLGAALSGTINEFITYSTALTTTQRQTIEGYLARKWGLTISNQFLLTHPFNRISPASIPFSPRNISGVALWLDAADTSSMTLSGSNVTQWNDKSGNGINMTGASLQPTFLTNAFNGKPTVSFAAVQGSSYQVLSNSSTNLYNSVSDISVFMAIYIPATTPRNPSPISLFGKVTIYIRGGGLGGETLYPWSYNNNGSYVFSLNNFVSANNYYICCFQFNTNQTFFMNGDTGTGGPTAFTFGSSTGIPTYIGYSGYNANDGFNGYISEIITYNTALTTSQRQQVEGYLAHKWGLTGSLPSTHPFKKFPA